MQSERVIEKTHNNPPNDAEILAQKLPETNAALLARRDELLAALPRLPDPIVTKQDAEKVTSYGAQLAACGKALESARKEQKSPYDQLAGVVQAFFIGKQGAIIDTLTRVQTVLKKYADEVRAAQLREEEEKRQAEAKRAAEQKAAADRLAEEAARLESAGMKAAAEERLAQAQTMEAAAVKAEQAVALPIVAPKAEPIRGSVGGSASTRGTWAVRITDINKIDLQALAPYFDRASIEKALRAKMKEVTKKMLKTETPPNFAGFEIYVDESINFRG